MQVTAIADLFLPFPYPIRILDIGLNHIIEVKYPAAELRGI
jgi:hypothetical protein